jgi:hypothetical protein
MGEGLIERYTGHGKLVFNGSEATEVSYQIDEVQEFISDGVGVQLPALRSRRGRVSHVEGHPDWHPITLLQREALTLVMSDGRKLKVLMRDMDGSVQATGDFF